MLINSRWDADRPALLLTYRAVGGLKISVRIHFSANVKAAFVWVFLNVFAYDCLIRRSWKGTSAGKASIGEFPIENGRWKYSKLPRLGSASLWYLCLFVELKFLTASCTEGRLLPFYPLPCFTFLAISDAWKIPEKTPVFLSLSAKGDNVVGLFFLCQNLRVTVLWFDAVSVELRIQIKCLYRGEDACVHILSSMLVSFCHYGSTPTPASTRRCQKINPWKNMQTCKSPAHKSIVLTARRCRSGVTMHTFVHMFNTCADNTEILLHTWTPCPLGGRWLKVVTVLLWQ